MAFTTSTTWTGTTLTLGDLRELVRLSEALPESTRVRVHVEPTQPGPDPGGMITITV